MLSYMPWDLIPRDLSGFSVFLSAIFLGTVMLGFRKAGSERCDFCFGRGGSLINN